MNTVVFSKDIPDATLRGKLSEALKAKGLFPHYTTCLPLDITAACPRALIALDATGFEFMQQARRSCPNATCSAIVVHHNAELADLIDGAYTFMLAHKLAVLGAYSESRFVVLTGEKGIAPSASLAPFFKDFASILSSRSAKHHFKTELKTVVDFELAPGCVEQMLKTTREWASLGCFSAYEEKDATLYAEAQFGFVARRTPRGTLITTRASNKSALSAGDLALIRDVNARNVVSAESFSGKKPSLNGVLAHRIFSLRPQIQWVVHLHAFMPNGVNAPVISAPGTLEDWLSIEKLVAKGERLINQPLHGSLILLEKPEELLTVLKAQNLYHAQSELYELAYARFQSADAKSPFEVAIRELGLPVLSETLDLCCGTGASTRMLKQLFSKVDFADGSDAMLSVAEKTLGGKGLKCTLPHLADLNAKRYDLIVMRQAFNYVSPKDRSSFFAAVRRGLNKGGWLVFNTFEPLPDGALTERNGKLEGQSTLVRTEEHNIVRGETITHGQRTELIDTVRGTWQTLFDVNSFYQHDIERIKQTLGACGFRTQVRHQGKSIVFLAQTDAIT